MIGNSVDQMAKAYRNFKTLLDAGHDVRASLGFLGNAARTGRAKQQVTTLSSYVENGRKLSDGMRVLQYPEIDIALTSVGEVTGYLPEVCAMMAIFYEERTQMVKAVKSALPQPLMLFGISVVTTSLPTYFMGKMSGMGFLAATVGPIAIVVGALVGGFEIYRRMLFSPILRRAVLARMEKIKGARTLVRALAMERFLNTAALSLKAGCDFFETVRLLQLVSADTYLQKVPGILKVYAPEEGLAKAMIRAKVFTDEQIASVTIGEATGTTAKAFEGMAANARDRVHGQINLFTTWAPKILYGIMVLYAAYGIIQSARTSPLTTGGVEEP